MEGLTTSPDPSEVPEPKGATDSESGGENIDQLRRQQPDFAEIANVTASITTQVAPISNLPAIDEGERTMAILAHEKRQSRRLRRRINDLVLRLDSR